MTGHNLTILIPGISGMIGKTLAHHWHAQGYEIIGISRKPKDRRANLPSEVMIVDWNALTPEFFAIRKIDVVVNLAGAPMMQRWDKKSKPEILGSRLNALEAIYSTIRKLPPSRRPEAIINASSVAIYSSRPDLVDESSETDLDINFFQSLVWLKLEKRMQELSIPDIRNIIARIGLLIGPHQMMQQMFALSSYGASAIIGDGSQKIGWISHHDLMRVFDHFIANKKCRDIYNVVAPTATTAQRFSESIAAAANRKVRFRLPEGLLQFLLGELADNFLVSAAIRPTRLLDENFVWNLGDIDAAVVRSRWALEHTRPTLQ